MQSPVAQAAGPAGLLLVGHGTRDRRGLAEFDEVAQQVQRLAGADYATAACFLEIAQPDIASGVERLLRQGIGRLTVSPLLLFAAGHAKRDIPAAVRAAVDKFQNVAVGGRQSAKGEGEIVVSQCAALECHERIVALSSERFEQATSDRENVPAEETLLLLVGRGSSEPTAIAEMHRFAELRAQGSAVARAECCFAAVAVPSLETALQRAADTAYRRIVVQPHLLFVGQVLEQIAAAVGEIEKRAPAKQWVVTPHLGASPLVAEAVLDLARRTGQALA